MKKTTKKLALKKATVQLLAQNERISGGGGTISGNVVCTATCSQRVTCSGTIYCTVNN